ncbi:hypothetical protein GH146_01635 [archaeon]|nr:hypothetical protein [archaeon]
MGYGGSCFPKDVKPLIVFSNRVDYAPIILQAVEEVNENQAKHTVKKKQKRS